MWLAAMRGRGVAVAVCLFASALAAGLLFARQAPESYDAQVMVQVARSMVDHGDFLVRQDPFGMNSPYSIYGIGMPALMAAPYWLAERLGADPLPWTMSVNAVLLAVIAVVMYLFGLGWGASRRAAVAVALATAFATSLLPYTATGFSEPGVALGGALGLLAIQARQPALAGLASGLALLMRVDSALLVAPVLGLAAWLACGRSRQAATTFLLGLLPAVLVAAAYDEVRFGAPWSVGYGGQPFNHPLLPGLYGLLLSPAAGLLLYVPLVAVAAAGVPAAWRRQPVVTGAAVALLGLRLPFYAAWWSWSAFWAWGPRFLVPAMPALAVGLLEVFRRWKRLTVPLRAAAAAVIAVSLAVQVVGAAVSYDKAEMFAAVLRAHPPVAGPGFLADATRPSSEAAVDRVEFDWRYFPVTDEAGDLLRGRRLAGRLLTPSVQYRSVAALAASTLALSALALLLASRAASPRSGAGQDQR